MKVFTESNAEFVVKIPTEWEYRNPHVAPKESLIHSFELYENPIGCFQISCTSDTKGNVPNLIQQLDLSVQGLDTVNLDFAEKIVQSSGFKIYCWFAHVGDSFIFAKYTHELPERPSDGIEEEISKCREALKSIMVISEDRKEWFLAKDRYDKFMSATAASIDLQNRAIANGSFIELIVLIANHIDGLLRVALILQNQLANSTDDIRTDLLFQAEGDPPIMEKKVYQMALKAEIIDQELHDSLFELYNLRNKVVHRYIITDLRTRDIVDIGFEYAEARDRVWRIVESLETEQHENRVGIYGTDESPKRAMNMDELKKIVASVKDKHAHDFFIDRLTLRDDSASLGIDEES